jgi:phosphate transport system permease protein
MVPATRTNPIPQTAFIRRATDRVSYAVMRAVTIFLIVLPGVLAVSLLIRSRPILEKVPIWDLLTSSSWHPARGQFGFLAFILGSAWVTILAMVIAAPLCLLTAIYVSEYASPAFAAVFKPVVDVLAGIPSIVYGLWGVLAIVPVVAKVAPAVGRYLGFVPGLSTEGFMTGDCVLSGALVLAVMVAPVIIAVSVEVLNSVPQELREAALSVGATKWQTVKHVVVRKSLAGLVAAVGLGFARALGETMAVLMVVGNVVNVPHSIFEPAYPLPALIANNYGEMMSVPLYDSALLLAALWLMVVVILFNLGARMSLKLVTVRFWR